MTEEVYRDLRAIAAARMRHERADHVLQPTALVHEAWIRMSEISRSSFGGRAQFLALGAEVIRRVLVDHARERNSQKRGGGWTRQPLPSTMVVSDGEPVDVLALEHALRELGARSERQARIVELRFFSGLDVQETAKILGISADAVKREWRHARAWLNRELSRGGDRP
jgi:RNA polymerase sigma factor (TIGR02999 family)